MPLVSLSHVAKFFGAEQVLADVTFAVDQGAHVGLVGVNGAGKSTILRLIAGIEEPDAGTVNRARGLRMAYLEQHPEFDAETPLFAWMLDLFREAIDAQTRLTALEQSLEAGVGDDAMLDEYSRLQAVVEHAGYDYRRRIETTLTGLGLGQDLWDTPMSALSGGQRTRANLARTLLQDADLLLLDEPTNHLDIPAVEWLEGYLNGLKGTFIIVAHDRYLLDRVTGSTLELSHGRVNEYDAPYSRYLALRAERAERQRLEYVAQQRQIERTEEFVRRYGAGQRSKEARGRQKRLDRMERIERPVDDQSIHLRIAPAARTGDIVLEMRDLVAGYPGRPLVRAPGEVVVRRSERIAVIGPNGSGKTTLLRTLLRALKPLSGTIRWGSNTDVGYYSQTLAQLDDRKSVVEEIRQVRPMEEEEARSFLGRFLFTGDDVYKNVGVLSGGERSRVALARLILESPNVLLLDEPTNHLDIASRDALQAVLEGFDGTLLFVSHDRSLIDALARQLWVVGEGRMVRYAGTYTEWNDGAAQRLDREEEKSAPAPRRATEPAPIRVGTLLDEAEALAGRLAEGSVTIPIGTLADLTSEYERVLGDLEETQREWIDGMRRQLRASSGSRDRSPAAKQQ